MKKRRKQSKGSFFDPDKIATAISQKLDRDLSSAEQMYGGMNETQRFFSKAQSSCTLKKYDSTVSDPGVLQDKAFDAFLEVNDHMSRVNEAFRLPRDIPSRHLTPLELTLKRARALVHWVLGDVTWGEIDDYATHSSGVSRGVPYMDTSLESKFSWPLSTTAAVIPLYRAYLADNRQLSEAVTELNRSDNDEELVEEFDIVDSSRATTVPKSSTKRRMIAIEPTLNMFFQQALMSIMYNRLRGTMSPGTGCSSDMALDVESLPVEHQLLAYWGSISGNLATIDFSSASDCVSIELLRYLLPKSWFDVLNAVRCPRMEIRGESIELHMFSTMGNAGTFPLETLVFWSLGVATVMQRTRKNPNSLLSLPEERASVSVFGDDCILPTADAMSFMDVAEAVGFRVNKEKSFFAPSPGFRESCGGDFLRGSNVRPLYIKAPTSTRKSALEPWLYIILNQVLKKYISYFGPTKYVYEKELLSYLFSLFRKHKMVVRLVPPGFPDDSGLQTTDWRRLRHLYNIRFDEVRKSSQGWYSFRYVKFQYRNKRSRDDYLQYCTWLRRPTTTKWWLDPRKPRALFPIRRKGGYVVARALSPSWTL